MVRLLLALTLVLSSAPAAAQPGAAGWDPAAAYITPGQDEAGYRNWYAASPGHPSAVSAFNNYLVSAGVGGVVPTWQLLRTATSWQRCGSAPFEVPPTIQWPHIVQTLRYVRDYVVPQVGPVEPVSSYRNPALNLCAGGAPESAHKHYSAIDLVPLRPTTRPALMHQLCTTHARRGTPYRVGLGFYAFLRFHVDTTRFRRWGAEAMPDAPPCPEIESERPALATGPQDMPSWAETPQPGPVTGSSQQR